MNKFITVTISMLLSACATTGTEMKAECEAIYTKFPDIYRCTYDAVAKRNPAILNDPRGKLYLLKGEQLSEQVKSGKISDIDAKVTWQEQLVKLRSENDNAVIEALPKRPPPINCTTQKFGNTVNTNCY
jgi:hypothetical protein